MNDYCQNLVRERDYHRYLLTFFAPRSARAAMYAVLALNIELETIPAKTVEPMAALIRLQWWDDQINLIYDGKTHSPSPILDDLKIAIHTFDIAKPLFDDLFTVYDAILRGTPSDPDDALYTLCGALIKDEESKHRFSKKLYLHDTMHDNTKCRALRLWLGV